MCNTPNYSQSHNFFYWQILSATVDNISLAMRKVNRVRLLQNISEKIIDKMWKLDMHKIKINFVDHDPKQAFF